MPDEENNPWLFMAPEVYHDDTDDRVPSDKSAIPEDSVAWTHFPLSDLGVWNAATTALTFLREVVEDYAEAV